MIAIFVLVGFLLTNVNVPFVRAQEFTLPAPGQMVALSPAYSPVVLKGIKLDPKNPFRFHFFVDTGDEYRYSDADNRHPERSEGSLKEQLKNESTKLIKYFLASLTIPEKDLWVNLSPYEKDRIVPQEFGQTEMGRDLLAQDYLLKQITASLIYPESKLGKEFWYKVYAQAQAKYGTTNIPINTFNKVWIIPDKAVVYENAGTAFVLENHLKVMLEQDYLSIQKHLSVSLRGGEAYEAVAAAGPRLSCSGAIFKRTTNSDVNALGSQIVRQIVIPALTKEVNEGKNFSQLRQVFYSLILATWYKNKIKDSILNKVYSNQNKINGVNISAADKDKIYQEYLRAFQKGVYNYIKEEPDQITGQPKPRKYFSGGMVGRYDLSNMSYVSQLNPAELAVLDKAQVTDITAEVKLNRQEERRKPADAAMSGMENEIKASGSKAIVSEIHSNEAIPGVREKEAQVKTEAKTVRTFSRKLNALQIKLSLESLRKEIDQAMTVEDLQQMIVNVLSDIDLPLAQNFSIQKFNSEDEMRQWVRDFGKKDDKNKDSRLLSLHQFFLRRFAPIAFDQHASLKNVQLTSHEAGYSAEFAQFKLSVQYNPQIAKTVCTLMWGNFRDWVYSKDQFSSVEAILNELIKEGILEDAGPTNVRLRSDLDQNTINRIREIAGNSSGKILRILRGFQDTWYLEGDWSKSTHYQEIIFLGGHEHIFDNPLSGVSFEPKVYGSMKEMYLEAIRIPLIGQTFEIVTRSRGKIKIKLVSITKDEITGQDEKSQEIPPITSEDFVQAEEADGAMNANQKDQQSNIFGVSQFQPDHPLVLSGRILKVTDYGKVTETEDLVEYAKNHGIQRIYFDLDLTIFRAKGYLSSSAWFENAVKEYAAVQTLWWWGNQGHESRQIDNGFFYRLMDPRLSRMIDRLHEAHIEVIGLTARAGDQDKSRTEEILERLGVKMDQVIFSSGASNKGALLDEFENKTAKPGITPQVPSLFVEDSFGNLVSVLTGRSHIKGIYYDAPTRHDEDGWGYQEYLSKAANSQAEGNSRHAFEYYFNAVVKLFELDVISREDAHKQMAIIYEKLLAFKDPKPKGYAQLLKVIKYALDGRSWLFHDNISRALRPVGKDNKGPGMNSKPADGAMAAEKNSDNLKQPEEPAGNGVTRRSFLQVFSALGLTAALPSGVINAAATKITEDQLGAVSRSITLLDQYISRGFERGRSFYPELVCEFGRTIQEVDSIPWKELPDTISGPLQQILRTKRAMFDQKLAEALEVHEKGYERYYNIEAFAHALNPDELPLYEYAVRLQREAANINHYENAERLFQWARENKWTNQQLGDEFLRGLKKRYLNPENYLSRLRAVGINDMQPSDFEGEFAKVQADWEAALKDLNHVDHNRLVHLDPTKGASRLMDARAAKEINRRTELIKNRIRQSFGEDTVFPEHSEWRSIMPEDIDQRVEQFEKDSLLKSAENRTARILEILEQKGISDAKYQDAQRKLKELTPQEIGDLETKGFVGSYTLKKTRELSENLSGWSQTGPVQLKIHFDLKGRLYGISWTQNERKSGVSLTLTEWLDKEWPSSKRFPGKTLAIEIPSHTNAGAIQAFFQARPWQYGGNPLDVSFTVKWPPPARLSPSDLENGGIDLNPAQMSMQVKKEGQDSKFDFNGIDTDAAQALTARGAVTGVTVTIRAMTPVTNLPEILGLNK